MSALSYLNVHNLDRKKLQEISKKHGIKANLKTNELKKY